MLYACARVRRGCTLPSKEPAAAGRHARRRRPRPISGSASPAPRTSIGSAESRPAGRAGWPKRGARGFARRDSRSKASCSNPTPRCRGRRRRRAAIVAAWSGWAAKRGKGPAFEKFKPFFCYVEVEGKLFTIVKQTGSQRPAGRLWEDDNTESADLPRHAWRWAARKKRAAYGDDPKRDMAGVFERIGPFQWRLVIPWPQNGAQARRVRTDPGRRTAQGMSRAARRPGTRCGRI